MTVWAVNTVQLCLLVVISIYAVVQCSESNKTQHVLPVKNEFKNKTSATGSNATKEDVTKYLPTLQDITKLRGQALFEAMVNNTRDQYSKLMSSKKTEDICPVSGSCITPKDTEVSSVSSECVWNIHHIQQEAKQFKLWAMQVLDSWGKVPSGILDGNLNWLGDFDACLKVDTTGQNLTIKYSLPRIYMQVHELSLFYKMKDIFFGPGVAVGVGLCIPDTCTDSDIGSLVKDALNVVNDRLEALAVVPFTPPKTVPWRTEMTFATIVVALLTALVVWATVYDLLVVPTATTAWTEDEKLKTSNKDYKSSCSQSQKHHKDKPDEEYLSLGQEHQIGSPGPAGKVLLSFSLRSNWTKLMNPDPEGTITCIHGLRVIAQSWIIAGHFVITGGFAIMDYVLVDNLFHLLAFLYTTVAGAFFICFFRAVNIFFAISGVLVTNTQLNKLGKVNPSARYISTFYLHRLWRLIPAFYFVLLLHIGLPMTAIGPMSTGQGDKKNWWRTVFFIKNFYAALDTCAHWMWYVCCDLQMFLISPLVFVLLHRYGRKALLVPSAFIIFSLVASGAVSWYFHLEPAYSLLKGVLPLLILSDVYHQTPVTALSSFMPGMITGYLLHVTPRSYRMDKWKQLGGWLFFTFLFFGMILSLRDHYGDEPWSRTKSACYNSVNTLVWGGATCWLIYACATGHGGVLNRVLSWKVFIPLSRISYSTYLSHMMIVHHVYRTQRRLLHIDATTPVLFFLLVVLSFLLGGVITLTVEMPLADLSKTLWPQIKQLFNNGTDYESTANRKQQDKTLHAD